MQKNVKPFVELSKFKNTVFADHKFRIAGIGLREHKTGWVEVSVDWTSKGEDSWKFKYCREAGGHSSFGCGLETVCREVEFLEFTKRDEVAGYDITPSINIGLSLRNPGQKVHLAYRAEYVAVVKYGVCVYFAPESWGEKWKTLLDRRERGSRGLKEIPEPQIRRRRA